MLLEQLASIDNSPISIQLGRTLRISYVIRTYDPRSYKLKQLAASDGTESDSYKYWVML
jgi:hypothetical protein